MFVSNEQCIFHIGVWTRREADVFLDVALRMGVPGRNILLETEATNTGENIRFSHRVLKERNIPGWSALAVPLNSCCSIFQNKTECQNMTSWDTLYLFLSVLSFICSVNFCCFLLPSSLHHSFQGDPGAAALHGAKGLCHLSASVAWTGGAHTCYRDLTPVRHFWIPSPYCWHSFRSHLLHAWYCLSLFFYYCVSSKWTAVYFYVLFHGFVLILFFLWSCCAGVVERIQDYPHKGFQVEQQLPSSVLSAYHWFLQAGYSPK